MVLGLGWAGTELENMSAGTNGSTGNAGGSDAAVLISSN